jgi:hypothetical protein
VVGETDPRPGGGPARGGEGFRAPRISEVLEPLFTWVSPRSVRLCGLRPTV